MNIRIGTRGSELALVQANWVKSQIESSLNKLEHCSISNIECEILKIETKGDLILDKALNKIGDKGLFTAELEQALLEQRIDIAVHCLKDLPTLENPQLPIIALPKRENPSDCIIFSSKFKGIHSILDLPEKSIIGTSSLRRISQIQNLRPDFQIVHLRGNVGTRLRKIDEGFEGISAGILACAGLIRLGKQSIIDQGLNPTEFIPAPGQGTLAIQSSAIALKNNSNLANILKVLNHEETSTLVRAERSALEAVDGGCQTPFGAYANFVSDNKKQIHLIGFIGEQNSNRIFRHEEIGLASESKMLGQKLGSILKDKLSSQT
jgi:hydroxymethylbilane synthase